MKILLLQIFIALLILWPLVRYALFLVSNYRSGHLQYIRTELDGLALPIFRGIITAMLAEAIALITYPFFWFMTDRPETSGTPVLMVHGLFHNASAWLLLSRRLKRAGFENLHTYQYNSFTKDFGQAVEGCEKKLESLVGGRPDAKVILIGHSLGGLVCRKVAGNALYRDRVKALVTLGTPHKGSDLAWFGGNTMSRGLIPGREAANCVECAPDPECPKLGIYTLVDDFVFPLSMLQTDRPDWQEQVCSSMGHVWMVYSREVTDMVIDFLRPVVTK